MNAANTFSGLSKSRFIAGLQCPLRLYQQVHAPELAEQGDNIAFRNGNAIGELARQLYPGVLVDEPAGLDAALATTARLIDDPAVRCIHEATFRHQGVLVRVDLLQRGANGWLLTEVKSATGVKQHYLLDAAIQAWVLNGCGLQLEGVRVMVVNKDFIYRGDGDYRDLLISHDVDAEVHKLLPSIGEKRNELVAMLQGEMPEVRMGERCKQPYRCEFFSACLDRGPAYPLIFLPRSREDQRNRLAANGWHDLRQIPPGVLGSAHQERVRRVTQLGAEEVDGAKFKAIDAWAWPRWFLDFETIAEALPRWPGFHPFQQVPFQFSLHCQQQSGAEPEESGFLDISGGDPRRQCAEALIAQIGSEGAVIAYNAGFERRVIKALAADFADLAPELMAIHDRIVDLLPVVRDGFYHPQQQGSWSIKAVLPVLVPELDYGTLDRVHNGTDAQLAWLEGVDEKDDEQRERIGRQLTEYCRLDTLAMVRIIEELAQRRARTEEV